MYVNAVKAPDIGGTGEDKRTALIYNMKRARSTEGGGGWGGGGGAVPERSDFSPFRRD